MTADAGGSRDLLAQLAELESPSTTSSILADNPVVWERAEGLWVTDTQGRRYLDMTAGSGVAAVGHTNPEVVAAAARQMNKLIHTGWTFASTPRVELLRRLTRLAPPSLHKAIFAVTGSEGMETGLKIARLHTGRPTVVAFFGSYHGKTLGSLSITSRFGYRQGLMAQGMHTVFVPYPYCYRCLLGQEYPGCGLACLDFLERTLEQLGPEGVAAVAFEPVQGSEGMIVPPPGFIARLRRVCAPHGIMLLADEIFSGMGRTGRPFAWEHDGEPPDIVVLGKGLGNGFPIAVALAAPEVLDAIPPFKQTSTFSGHPLACAVGVAVLDYMERHGVVANAAAMGDYLLQGLRRMAEDRALIGEVRGRGLMIGIELVRDERRTPAVEETKEFARLARERGLLLLTGGQRKNVLKLTPPLTISQREADRALAIIDDVFATIQA